VKLNGTDTMTQAVQAAAGTDNGITGIWYIAGRSSPTVLLTPSIGLNTLGISIGVMSNVTTDPGAAGTTATQTYNSGSSADAQTPGSSIVVPAGGVILAVQGSENLGTPSWDNAGTSHMLADDALTESGWDHNTAHSTASGTLTPAISGYDHAGSGMSAALWV
jgi:hypothetical protein